MTEPVLSVEQMVAAEKAAMDAGTSEWELMQRAGEGAAQWVWRMAAGRAVTVLCGPGNNGGDGYVIAEFLRAKGVDTAVIAPVEPSTDTAKTAREHFRGEVRKDLGDRRAPVMVDCLFGYGLSRAVEGDFAEVLSNAAQTHPYRIAIDVPSGVESDTGVILSEIPDCDLTLALGGWKRAHFLMPAMAQMGEARLVPIGLDLDKSDEHLSARPKLRAPSSSAHKYSRGLLAIVAGEMPGAPLLSAEAAMRAGAGYVKLLSQHSHPDAPADLVIEEGDLDRRLADERIGGVLCGPGLGRDDNARERLEEVLEESEPTVLDADALYLLNWDLLEGVDTSRIIVTPHEGELVRLCNALDITSRSKLQSAQALRDATGLTVLAKGPDTLLAPGDGGMRYFERGSSWLSVAGSGDVLAGIIAARLASGECPADAAEQGVWIHHEAARLAGAAFTAGELARAVKPALASFL